MYVLVGRTKSYNIYIYTYMYTPSSNNKTLNARLLARVITGCRRDFLRSLTELLTPAFINNKT